MSVTCPNCKKKVDKTDKTWKYGPFTVQAFTCNNCGTQFREYTKDGKHSFTLQNKKGRKGGFTKV